MLIAKALASNMSRIYMIKGIAEELTHAFDLPLRSFKLLMGQSAFKSSLLGVSSSVFI